MTQIVADITEFNYKVENFQYPIKKNNETNLKAKSAMSWNQMALTTFERRKNGRTQRVEKATERTGSV